jgi:hypothetical protein
LIALILTVSATEKRDEYIQNVSGVELIPDSIKRRAVRASGKNKETKDSRDLCGSSRLKTLNLNVQASTIRTTASASCVFRNK